MYEDRTTFVGLVDGIAASYFVGPSASGPHEDQGHSIENEAEKSSVVGYFE